MYLCIMHVCRCVSFVCMSKHVYRDVRCSSHFSALSSLHVEAMYTDMNTHS